MQQIRKYNKNKKKGSKNKFWNLSIWNKLDQTMVRERDTFWNPFLESVLKVDAKLTKLGFIFLDGQVAIIDPNGEVTRV